MSSKHIEKAVREYVARCDGWQAISAMAGAVSADLFYGDLTGYEGLREAGLMQGGFVDTCRAIAAFLEITVGTLYVDDNADHVSTCKSDFHGDSECACEGSGYVYVETDDGRSTMTDCPNADCNAFGQMDTTYTTLDRRDIAKILFGSELAPYIY